MLRSLLDKLSGIHITILALAALFVPGALGAAVISQAVSIVDPDTGSKASLDASRRLLVYDPIAGFANHPANIVNIVKWSQADNTNQLLYKPPAGKALVIKSVQLSYYANAVNNDIALFLGNSSGRTMATYFAHDVSGTISKVFEPGSVLRDGQQLTMRFGSADRRPFGWLFVQGFLVPDSGMPATASLEATQQFVQAGPALK